MKTVRYLSMMLAMLAMSVSFVSCSSDDDETFDSPINPCIGQWTYTEKFEEDGIEYALDYSITFSTSTATYKYTGTIKQGTQTQSVGDYANYTYTYSDGLVVMTPTEAGKAYLEGKITSNIKMVVTNVSTQKQIGIFYKQ